MGTKTIARVALAALLMLFGHAAFATPARCQAGYQDSTCTGAISAPAQAAPTCPSTIGVVTVQPAVWQGTSWSSPQCETEAEPTCPTGYTTLSAASWTGSSWTPPSCQLVVLSPIQVCQGSFPAGYTYDPNFASYEYTQVAAHYQASSVGNLWYLYLPPSLSSTSLVGELAGSENVNTGDTIFWLELTGPSYTAYQSVCGSGRNPYTATGYNAVCQVNPTTGALDGWIIEQNGSPSPTDSSENCGEG